VPERDFWQVVLGSAAVTQQLCTVIAAVSIPVYLRLGLLEGCSLLLLNVVLLLIVTSVLVQADNASGPQSDSSHDLHLHPCVRVCLCASVPLWQS